MTVMCEKRITNLRRLLVKPNRPIQSVTPEVVIKRNSNESITSETKKEIDKRLSNGVDKSVSIISSFAFCKNIFEFCPIYHVIIVIYSTNWKMEFLVTRLSN